MTSARCFHSRDSPADSAEATAEATRRLAQDLLVRALLPIVASGGGQPARRHAGARSAF